MEDIQVICSHCNTPAVLVAKDREYAFVKTNPKYSYVCRKCQQPKLNRYQTASYATSPAGQK
ncbi:MAG: hypothetical protein JWN30_1897 [Bacilli bacterium]|nr:hypothetical protein [Bacilli bacterium]